MSMQFLLFLWHFAGFFFGGGEGEGRGGGSHYFPPLTKSVRLMAELGMFPSNGVINGVINLLAG